MSLVMQSTPLDADLTGSRGTVSSVVQADGERRRHGVQPAALKDGRRRVGSSPIAIQPRAAGPGRRPSQPTSPLIARSVPSVWSVQSDPGQRAVISPVRSLRTRAARGWSSYVGPDWQFTERGLLVIMIAFAVMIVIGFTVVIGSFVSVSNAPADVLAATSFAALAMPS